MRQSLVGIALFTLLAGWSAPAAAGTVSISTSLDLFSNYVWRGLTLNNGPVSQPGLYLGTAFAGGTLTAGTWASVEPFSTGGSDISQRGPDNVGVGEIDYSVEWSRAIPSGTATLGAVQYTLHGTEFSSGLNTSELYAKAGFGGPLSPSFALYVDVDKVKGAYLEAGVAGGVPFGARVLEVSAVAGFCAGQSAGNPQELANFFDDGMSHVDVMAKMKFVTGSLSVSPLVHAVLNVDDNTRRVSADPTDWPSVTKYWGGVSLAWSH